VPVGSEETARAMREIADEVVCPMMPKRFRAVGEHYGDFSETTDEEVRNLLAASRAHAPASIGM
jgi:predicted phosphoribosyltransferase